MVHFDAKLTGSVEDVSLADLLQLFHYVRKSATLHVSGETGGRVVIVDGQLRHAECGPHVGEAALTALMSQKLVRVCTSAVEDAPLTIERAFTVVLIDLLRQIDENSRDLPPAAPVPTEVVARLERGLSAWLEARREVAHAAVIDPRRQFVIACDSRELWGELARSVLLQTLVAPYFDDSFTEIDGLLPKLAAGFEGEECQTVVTFSGRRYVLALVPDAGWVAALVFRAADVSPGLSLTYMVGFRQAVLQWRAEAAA